MAVENKKYDLVPSQIDKNAWELRIGETLVAISKVSLDYNEVDDSLHFNFDHKIISGPDIPKESIAETVEGLMVEMAEYHEGRKLFLAEKE